MSKDKMPVAEKVTENGRAFVERIVNKHLPEQTEQTLEVRQFAPGTTPARVHYAQRITINLGNYESAQVLCGVELPCYPEEVDEAFVSAKTWTDTRIAAEVAEIESLRRKHKI